MLTNSASMRDQRGVAGSNAVGNDVFDLAPQVLADAVRWCAIQAWLGQF